MINFSKKSKTIFALLLMVFLASASLFFILPMLGNLLLSPTHHGFISNQASPVVRQFFYGLTLSLPQIFIFFGAPIWGALSDKIGRKSTILYALLGIVLSLAIILMALKIQSLLLLMLGQALLGMTDASETVAQAAIIDISSEAHKTKNIAWVSLAGTLGIIVGPLFGGFFSDQTIFHGFNDQVAIEIALLVVIANIFIIKFLFPTQPHYNKCKMSWHFLNIQSFKFILDTPGIKKVLLIFLCLEAALAIFYQAMSILLYQLYHFSSSRIGVYFVVFSLVICLSYLFVIPVLSKFFYNKWKVIGAAFILISITMIGLFFCISAHFIWWVMISIGPAFAIIYCFSLSLLSDLSPKVDQGKMIGVSMAMIALGFLFSVILIAMIPFIYLVKIFSVVAVICLVGAFQAFRSSTHKDGHYAAQ